MVKRSFLFLPCLIFILSCNPSQSELVLKKDIKQHWNLFSNFSECWDYDINSPCLPEDDPLSGVNNLVPEFPELYNFNVEKLKKGYLRRGRRKGARYILISPDSNDCHCLNIKYYN